MNSPRVLAVVDPDLAVAAVDMADAWPAEEVLRHTGKRRIGLRWPLDPGSCIARASRLPVSRRQISIDSDGKKRRFTVARGSVPQRSDVELAAGA